MDELGITIDRGSGTPASMQVKAAVRCLVDAGGLTPGDRLPTVRAFALQLGIAPNTVARAYRELESEGYVIGRGRAGTFVADEPPEAETADLDDIAAAYLVRTRAAGFTDVEAVGAVRRAAEDPSA
jgi:GntR family transcriptional regulator